MRITSNQPQMHFSRKERIIVKPDTTVTGQSTGRHVYQQGDDYMIITGLQEALYLARMGYTVEIKS